VKTIDLRTAVAIGASAVSAQGIGPGFQGRWPDICHTASARAWLAEERARRYLPGTLSTKRDAKR